VQDLFLLKRDINAQLYCIVLEMNVGSWRQHVLFW